MCGVFGYIGERDAVEVCLSGLEHLEYRGYDSTGIAGICDGKIALCKRAGKLARLKQVLDLPELQLAIAHTRWATHGIVNDQNAHPHLDTSKSLAIIHNGVIENYASLREGLEQEGVLCASETDTEIIVQLIAKHYCGDLVQALHAVIPLLQGMFALAVIHKDHPDQMVAAARGCPLSIAINDKQSESIISSDPNAFIGADFHVIFLEDMEVAKVSKGAVEIYNAGLMNVQKRGRKIQGMRGAPSKEGFEHFMLKEIYEQPKVLQKAISNRFKHTVQFDELRLNEELLRQTNHVWILGCGTSAHAGNLGAILFEELSRLSASCEIASEARFRTPLFPSPTLAIAISQSGETADTLAALREAKKHGCRTIALCNVENSAIVREADGAILLHAGIELSVCSTKAFSNQLAMLYLFALFMGQIKKHISPQLAADFYARLQTVPGQIQQVLEQAPAIEKLGKKYARYHDFFFMGRRYMFPTCTEAALKLKEISYANANGYPAGELKHGPLALLDAQFPVIAFCANNQTQDKILANLMEVKARGAPVLAIAPAHMDAVRSIADDVLWMPSTSDELAPFSSTVAAQLLAYYIAKERGCDIDQPRNLAKSVTVE